MEILFSQTGGYRLQYLHGLLPLQKSPYTMTRLIIPALVALLVSGSAWGEALGDLVQRDGL